MEYRNEHSLAGSSHAYSLSPDNYRATSQTVGLPEALRTLKAAAEHFGVPLFKLRRAAKHGAFPIYRIGNGRALCRLSEVDAAINASRVGGGQ